MWKCQQGHRQLIPHSPCLCLCPFMLRADSPGQPCPDTHQESAPQRQEVVVAPNPAACRHAVPRALCLPQAQGQLCAFSRALCTAQGADPSRGHEVGTTHTSMSGQPSSPHGSARPLGGDKQDRGTGTASLTGSCLLITSPPCPPSSAAVPPPWPPVEVTSLPAFHLSSCYL